MKFRNRHIILIALAAWLCSCSASKKFTLSHYDENKNSFQSVYSQYKELYSKRPFSMHTQGKEFDHASLEILSDTMNYIYDFDLRENKINDTLKKYRFDSIAIRQFIHDMQTLNCTWVTKLDYFENRQKKYMVFLSIRHRKLESLFKKNKYFTLAFFDEAQPSDNEGRLQDRRNRRNLRKINGANFYRINDRIFYSVSRTFR